MGQLVEAALAHKQLTGKDDLMEVMWRNVDLISRTFGNGRSQLKRVPGHESPEIALPKLWRFAHEPATMELIRNFIDWRGRADLRPLYGTPGSTVFDAAYYQDHKPVREQREAVGHAVRACYLYTGMAEMLALTGDQTLRPALDAIWENVVGRKMYVTGGVGAHHAGEKFGADFELPNEKGYLETCATLANALWQFRMFRLDGDAKYIDVFERILRGGRLHRRRRVLLREPPRLARKRHALALARLSLLPRQRGAHHPAARHLRLRHRGRHALLEPLHGKRRHAPPQGRRREGAPDEQRLSVARGRTCA